MFDNMCSDESQPVHRCGTLVAHNQCTAPMNGLAFVTAHDVEHMYNFIMETYEEDALE
jgi:hypothetical protein